MKWYCPVCGCNLTSLSHDKDNQETNPFSISEVLNNEICPSCGIQFGYDDFTNGDIKKMLDIYRKFRRKWIDGNMKWWAEHNGGSDERKPQNWNPQKQLENIADEFK